MPMVVQTSILTECLKLGVLALFSAMFFTFVVRSLSQAFGFIAKPRADRWHSRPTALLGGVAMWAAFSLVLALTVGAFSPSIVYLFLGALSIFILGLVDDLYQLRPYVKLIGQIISALFLVKMGFLLPWSDYHLINAGVTLFWIVGITNAVNLLDNMDGLSAGICAIASFILVATFLLNGQVSEAYVVSIFLGAVLGFLFFNFSPASIFMGDSGSMFLGYFLAGAALLSDYGRTRNLTAVLLTPVMILAIPILDTCLVTITRKISGRAVSQGGRDHTSHRLVALGMSERRAVLFLYAVAITCGAVPLALRGFGDHIAVVVVPLVALFLVGLGYNLGMVKIYESAKSAPPSALRLLVDFGYKRRVFEVVLDSVLIFLAYYVAHLIRWDGTLPDWQQQVLFTSFPYVLGVELMMFLLSGMYSGLWRYTGIDDILLILRSAALASVASGFLVLGLNIDSPVSRGVLVLNGILLFLALASSRLSIRVVRDGFLKLRSRPQVGRKILLYGADERTTLTLRELLKTSDPNYQPVGIIDEDPLNAGKRIHGVKIFNRSELTKLIEKEDIKEVIVTSGTVDLEDRNLIASHGISVKRLRLTLE